MEYTNQLPFLSDVIDYGKDIEPYKLIQIYSGVGSGKNYWVKTLAEQGRSILFITSRKITAEVQAQNMGVNDSTSLTTWYKKKNAGKSVKPLVSCTYSAIESFIKKIYNADNPDTYIWNFFDLIIVDEAHSLITDADFASASFHVWSFICWMIKQENNSSKVILMSGTPEPLNNFLPDVTRRDKQFHLADYYEKCNHVDPKEVIIHRGESMSAVEIVGYWKEGKRIIYFAERIKRIKDLVTELRKYGIPDSDIGVSYSGDGKTIRFSKEMLEKKKRIEKSLKDNEQLPDDVKIFLSTTKNKEGINIWNDDIKIMFTESTQRAELIQMSARVRKGLDKLIVMTNLPENKKDDYKINIWKQYITKQLYNQIIEQYKHFITNENVKEYCLETIDGEEVMTCEKILDEGKIIDDIEKCFPYIKYDYFLQDFVIFKGKVYQEELCLSDNEDLKNAIFNWYVRATYVDTGEYANTGAEDFQEWFPYSHVYKVERIHERLPSLSTHAGD